MAPEGTKAERQTLDRFIARYGVGQNEATRAVELAVIGGDWGGNRHTTAAHDGRRGPGPGVGPRAPPLALGSGRGGPRRGPAKRHARPGGPSDPPAQRPAAR